MAKIKSLATGDVFEAPAADFAGNTGYVVVDDATPITPEVPSGEPVSATSAPVVAESSGTTSTETLTPSSEPALATPTPTISEIAVTSNAVGASASSAVAGDTVAADAATPVVNPQTPPTDSVAGNPTGGPIAGAGDTVEAKAKHGLIERIETELRAELNAVEQLPEHAWHVLKSVFDRHHSQVDTDAAQ